MFQFQVWFLPFLILVVTTALAIPFSRYLAWIMDGHYRAPRLLPLDRAAPGHGTAELEAVRGRPAAVQHG